MSVKRSEDHGIDEIRRIGDCIVSIQEARDKIMPVIILRCSAVELNPGMGEVLTKEQFGNLGLLLKEMLDEVFTAVDGIEDIYRRSFYV